MIKRAIRRVSVFIWNASIFLIGCIRHGIPPWLWPMAWREVEKAHEDRVRQILWDGVMAGKIRKVDDRYYPVEDKE